MAGTAQAGKIAALGSQTGNQQGSVRNALQNGGIRIVSPTTMPTEVLRPSCMERRTMSPTSS